MSNKMNWGYDDTKKMLNTLRTLNESKKSSAILKEEFEQSASQTQQEPQTQNPQQTQNQDTDFIVVNDVEVKIHSSDKEDLQLTTEEKGSISQLIDNFRQQVSDLAEFKEGINIDMASNEFRLDGDIPDEDISFVLMAGNDQNGVYINADMLKINDDIVLTLGKLFKFQHSFADTASQFLNTRKTN